MICIDKVNNSSCPHRGDHGHAAVVVPHHVGVARVVDEGQGAVARGADLALDAVLHTAGRNLDLGNLMRVARQVLEVGQQDSSHQNFVLEFNVTRVRASIEEERGKFQNFEHVGRHQASLEQVPHAPVLGVADQGVDCSVVGGIVHSLLVEAHFLRTPALILRLLHLFLDLVHHVLEIYLARACQNPEG